jgi:TolA-binding protein
MIEAHFLRGQSLRENGSFKEAIEEFNRVINLKPTYVQVSKDDFIFLSNS